MTEEINEIEKKGRDVVQIDSATISDIEGLIDEKADKSLNNILSDLHYADIAEIINHLDFDDGVYLFRILEAQRAGDVVTEIDENLREKLLNEFNVDEIAIIVDELETDDATDILSDLPENVQEKVLEKIDIEDSKDVKVLLKYDEESAGGIMDSDFVFVNEKEVVKDAIREVRKYADEYETLYQLFVVDDDGKLIGAVSLKALIINLSKTPITDIMEEDLIYVTPEVDQEEVAEIMKKYDLVVIPVVDENKVMVGRITIDDIVDVMEDEASEDIQKIAGLSEEQETSDSIFRASRIRLPWLIIALAMELVAAVVLSQYEAVISQMIVATFFIPVVMAMGGSTGTQAAIVMVRSMGPGEIYWNSTFKHLGKEFGVSLLNGIACSIILLGSTLIFWPRSEVTIEFSILLSISLLIIIIVATMVGSSIPILLKWAKTDPAIATGPFVTTANDILGLLIYLSFIILFFID